MMNARTDDTCGIDPRPRKRRFVRRSARALAWGTLAFAVVLVSVSAARAQFVFDPPVNFSFDFDAWPTSIGHGDFNDDGLIDLAVTGRSNDGLLLILMGSEETGFDPAVPLKIGGQTEWVVAEFLDTDLHVDLGIAPRGGVGKVAVLKGTGSGAFGARADYPVGRGPTHMVARDFDGDGDTDVAVMDNTSSTVTLLLNDGNAVFTSSGQINHVGRLGKGLSGAFYLTAADFDGDLDFDVAVARASGYVTVLMNNGDATFGKPVHYTAGTATGIAAGDVDGDGDIDIVFGDLTLTAPGFLGVLRNQGNGLFGDLTKFPMTGTTMWFVALADLDGDGLLDPIVSDALGQQLFLFHNESADGQLALADPQQILVGGFPRSVFAVDLDDDCDLDLLIASLSTHRVQVLINNTPQINPCRSAAASGRSPARFASPKETKAKTPAPRRPVIADTNADGRIDAADLAAALQEWR